MPQKPHERVYQAPNSYGYWDKEKTREVTEEQAREYDLHKTTTDCWCQPRKEAYGRK